MVDVKRIILGVADIIRGEEWSPMDVNDPTTSLENNVIEIMGDYAKKHLGLKAMVINNKDFGKIEEFLEEIFKYGERVYNIGRLKRLIAVIAYFTIYLPSGRDEVIKRFMIYYTYHMKDWSEAQELWSELERDLLSNSYSSAEKAFEYVFINMRTTSSGGITMMVIVAIIIICITIGMFYTSEKMKSVENATLVTSKRERVMNFTGVKIPLEKIIIKKVHSNGTVEIMETWNDDNDKDLLTIYEEKMNRL